MNKDQPTRSYLVQLVHFALTSTSPTNIKTKAKKRMYVLQKLSTEHSSKLAVFTIKTELTFNHLSLHSGI